MTLHTQMIETLRGNEPKVDEVNVTEGEVVTPAKSNESEISGKNVSVGDTSFVDDRISIETVGNETKGDQVHVASEGEVTTQENSNDQVNVLSASARSCNTIK